VTENDRRKNDSSDPSSRTAGSDQANDLRKRAEELLHKDIVDLGAITPEELPPLLHELAVQRIELTMQNEYLRRTQAELDAERARYFDLYDLAPVGYCTLSEEGLILEANLTAVTLLGVARRGDLIKQPLSSFILKEDQDIYYLYRKQLLETHSASSLRPSPGQAGQAGKPQACELRMVRHKETIFWARLEAAAAKDADGVCHAVAFSDITERKLAEEALRGSEDRYRRITEGLSDYLYTVLIQDRHVVQTTHNHACEVVTGYTAEEFASNPHLWIDMVPEQEHNIINEHVKGILSGKNMSTVEHHIVQKDGKIIWVSDTPILKIDSQGVLISYDGVIKDITERKQGEEQIKASLREKEVLLKEIQHRVKNNLLTISGILALQLGRTKDNESKDAFITSMNRVNALTQIHTRLYQSEDFSRIGLKEYIKELVWELSRSYGFPPENMITNIEDIYIDINTAIPAGLIVNELVSNAMKHAFPFTGAESKEQRGEITIILKEHPAPGDDSPLSALRSTLITLSISDNGIGLPHHIDIRKTKSLGLSLIVRAVEQINGDIEVIRENGTQCIITFSVDQEKTP
jgi:PAS domain S-box-containing protein